MYIIGRKAFTLAEVLITLGIIGVVAALTTPVLMNKAFESGAVAKLKKDYSILSQALTMAFTDEGCIGNPNICINNYDWRDCQHSFAAVEKNLKLIDIKYNDSGVRKSWMRPHNGAYGMDGTLISEWAYYIGGTDGGWYNYCNYELADGAVLTVFHQGWRDSMIDFVLDINGNQKPNRVGKDIFHFFSGDGKNSWTNKLPQQKRVLYPYFGKPYGTAPTDVCVASATVCNPDDGKSPAAYVLLHNKLPDLTSMGYPSSP